jgi:hypothetical protein
MTYQTSIGADEMASVDDDQFGQHAAHVIAFRRALNIANPSFASGLRRFAAIRLCAQP